MDSLLRLWRHFYSNCCSYSLSICNVSQACCRQSEKLESHISSGNKPFWQIAQEKIRNPEYALEGCANLYNCEIIICQIATCIQMKTKNVNNFFTCANFGQNKMRKFEVNLKIVLF